MTSDEIKQKPAADLSTNSWLKELCLQVALLNESSPAVINMQAPKNRNPKVN